MAAGPSRCAAASISVCMGAAWVGWRLGRYHGRLAAAGDAPAHEAAHARGGGDAAAPNDQQGLVAHGALRAAAETHQAMGLAAESVGKGRPLSRPASAAWREQTPAVKDGSPQLRRQRSARE